MPDGIDSPSENYFRVQRYTYFKGNVITKLVKAAEITALANVEGFSATDFVSGKDWIKVADGTAFPVSGGQGPDPETGVYVALRFQNDGTDELPAFKVTGLALSANEISGSGQVMTSSCWTSVLPAQ
jgi:hypothetical protein